MDDPIERAENLIDKAEDLDNRINRQTEQVINELVTYKERDVKWKIFITTMGFVVMIMLFFGIFAVIKIRDNAASIKDFCEATNKANAEQAVLWRFILDIPPDPNETDNEKAIKIAFTDLVERTFAPHDCSQQRVIP